MIQNKIIDIVDNYYKFFLWAWPSISGEDYVNNWHVKYLCDKLQDLSKYIINREKPPYDELIINISPGESKSSIVSQAFPVWLWLQDPSLSSMIATYSDSLSTRNTKKSKDIIQDPHFEHFNQYIEWKHGKRLVLKVAQNNYLQNNYGGEISGTSISGTITGFHFNLLIWDDIINPKQASSEAERKQANNFLDHTLPSRKKDKKIVPEIGIMQRLNEDDPTGHELEKAEQGKIIYQICLPGELTKDVKPEEVKKYYVNGLFDTKRLDMPELNKLKIDLGSYGYAGQILQRPSPEEGGLLKRDYWNYSTAQNIRWNMFVDGAYTAKKQNDPSGVLIAGVLNNNLYVKYAASKYMESPEFLKYIPGCLESQGIVNCKIYIEPKASGQSLRPMLNKMGYNAIDITSKLIRLDKVARANEVLPRIESGKVYLIRGAWNDEFIEQCAAFPNAKHDEYVDLISYAIDILLPFQRRQMIF